MVKELSERQRRRLVRSAVVSGLPRGLGNRVYDTKGDSAADCFPHQEPGDASTPGLSVERLNHPDCQL